MFDLSSIKECDRELLKVSELAKITDEVKRPIWSYWEEFVYDYCVIRGMSQITLRNVRFKLRFIILTAQIYSIDELNDAKNIKSDLAYYKIERNWSGVTYNSYKKDLNTFTKWLEEEGYIEKNEMKRIQKIKTKPKAQPCLTVDEVNKIKTYVLETSERTKLAWTRNVFMLNLLFVTGLRTCELVSLNLDSIRKEKGEWVLYVEGAKQKGKVRSYVMKDYLVNLFLKYLEERNRLGRNDKALFVSSRHGKRLTNSGVQRYLSKLSSRCGVEVTVYHIRRYVATRLYEKSVDLNAIRHYLGHTRVSTTLRYIQNTALMTNDSMDVLMGELLN